MQRNSHSEKDAVSVTISTDLNVGDNTTLTVQEDGIPNISGPAGQRYDLTYSEDNGGGAIPDATVDEIMEFFGEEPLPSFADVPANAYYADAVQWAVEQGITTGTSSTTFSPDDPCTRAQVVTFLWRTDYPPKKITGPVGFNDVHVGDYFWFPVKWALENEITSGTSENTFSPNQICTRAQVVTFLYRDFALR